jgi:glycosyltransferase involved in cell wall biosynthesis
VLLVGNFLHESLGTYGLCEQLAIELATVGWRVLTTSHQRRRALRLVDMLRTAWNRRADYQVAQVDVFSGPAFFWAEATCWVLRRARKPYVLTLHGGSLPQFARRWPHRTRSLFRSAAAVTTPSRYLLEQLAAYRANAHLIPNGLRIERYSFRPRSAPKPRLIWLRSFHDIYNPTLAAQVLALLATDLPDVHLEMVGPDRGDGSLQRMWRTAQALGVAHRITAPGSIPKDDVPGRLEGADIFLNTANVDNTPVSVIEALAAGLCVVSTNVGGLPYLLDAGRDALLVPPRDAASMAAAVLRLIREPALALRLSTNGRHKAETMNWGRVIAKWNVLLTEVALDQSGRGSSAAVPTLAVDQRR